MIIKPFLKWAGGKNQLLPKIRNKYPSSLGVEINRYCEPFVGGGAVLFDILSNYEIKEVLINDINVELINTYTQIKQNITPLVLELENIENAFLPLLHEQRKEFYYKKREQFNYLKINGNTGVNIEKAALFIFLNKTCFNGLFRVNKQGLFNVPMGAYKKPMICDKENLLAINRRIQNIKITCGDYKDCFSFIDKNTFVYVDPPYRPLTDTASFTSYDESPFDDKEQIDLSKFIAKIHYIGAKIVVSNSDPKNNNEADNFFDDLYKAFIISRVTAKRMINCNGENRGNISELLITNY